MKLIATSLQLQLLLMMMMTTVPLVVVAAAARFAHFPLAPLPAVETIVDVLHRRSAPSSTNHARLNHFAAVDPARTAKGQSCVYFVVVMTRPTHLPSCVVCVWPPPLPTVAL